MRLQRLWLADFRNYSRLELELPPGTSLIVGPNGEGKTNLLEAIFYLATMTSFRVNSTEALIRTGPDVSEAVVRGEMAVDQREVLFEAALRSTGRSQFQVNRQRVRRRDLLGLAPVSIFMPDDLVLLKGGPGERRRFLDDVLSQIDPRLDAARADMDNILRQRNALLRQSGGRLDSEAAVTLDVWDEKLADVGERLTNARRGVVAKLDTKAVSAYKEIAVQAVPLDLAYESTWSPGGLKEALVQARSEDLRRGVTTVGPHRDDVAVVLDGRPARTHASQGEQRSLALALRLAAHRELEEATGQSPLLLLDDVFSELDPDRCRGVLGALQSEQTLLTTAGALPADIAYSARFRVADGRVIREV
ncbi:DNA replication/repair protein RecF [Candidatus Poriferisocius sp.]|uniref:DNA replication/repair protein RecF n=1 Tax=Candidatus Poriferisocius sp. TaxID=3101276 RepID=UPI003B01DCC8